MAMAGDIGAGTLGVIILIIILAILMFLYICEVPFMKFIFWGYVGVFIIILIICFTLPYDTQEKVESNPHFAKLCSFGVFIFVGFAVSIVFYIIVVLLHQDFAMKLPKT